MTSVLLIDDDLEFLELEKIFLGMGGDLVIDTAESAQSALEKLSSYSYDAIVSDYQMPKMSGLELLKELRKRGDDTPFIIFTGRGREEVVIEALNAGADFYLQKGGQATTQFTELKKMIEHAVDKRRIEKRFGRSLDMLIDSQEELIRAEENYHNLFNRMLDAFALHEIICDENGVPIDYRFLAVNPAFESMTGLKAEEIIGKTVLEVLPRTEQYWIDKYGRVALNGETLTFDEYAISFDKYFKVHAFQTSYGHFATIFHDITESKRIEAALLESRERLKYALEGTGAGLWDWYLDTDKMVLSEQWKRMLGYEVDELEDSYNTWKMLCHPDDVPRVKEAMRNYCLGESHTFEVSYRMRHKDGGWRWIISRGEIRRNEAGKPIRWTGTNIDITDQKHVEEALRLANNKLHLLSDITRHDVINHVFAIKGYLELLKDQISDENTKNLIERILTATERIERDLKLTRDYECIGLKEPRWISLAQAVSGIPDGYINFEMECCDYSIFADPMLHKVFENLFDNTIRHATGATWVRMHCKEDNGHLVIVWEDNGPGIKNELKDRIFEQGFGLNSGLGLYLIRDILSLTEIEIVETGIPGKGARFEIRVPPAYWRVDDDLCPLYLDSQ